MNLIDSRRKTSLPQLAPVAGITLKSIAPSAAAQPANAVADETLEAVETQGAQAPQRGPLASFEVPTISQVGVESVRPKEDNGFKATNKRIPFCRTGLVLKISGVFIAVDPEKTKRWSRRLALR